MRTEEEYKKLLQEEKDKYDKERAEFLANPIHWTNNKRKRNGLNVLRGKVNKCRSLTPPAFRSNQVFWLIEDMIDDILPKKINENFGQFVDVKDIAVGDTAPFYSIEDFTNENRTRIKSRTYRLL